MPTIEYDCGTSTALARITYNKEKMELHVKFRSGPKIYQYPNVSSRIEELLLSVESKGRIIAENVRKYKRFRVVDSFPMDVQMHHKVPRDRAPGGRSSRITTEDQAKDNEKVPPSRDRKRHSSKKFKNFSSLWLYILENPQALTRSYLDSMLTVLQTVNPHYPPSVKPPRQPEPDFEDGSIPSSKVTSIPSEQLPGTQLDTLSNQFSDLSMDSDDEAESHSDLTLSTNTDMSQDTTSIQVRYLKIKVICGIAELYRREALQAQKDKNYVDVKNHWVSAWKTLHHCSTDIDRWYAILCSYPNIADDPSIVLSNKHDAVQLLELFAGLQLLSEDTEREKNGTLRYLRKRLQYTMEKLNPMLKERNEVKAKIGEKQWKDNPDPKQSYAERRAQWEKDFKDLSEAVEAIEPLGFVIVGTL